MIVCTGTDVMDQCEFFYDCGNIHHIVTMAKYGKVDVLINYNIDSQFLTNLYTECTQKYKSCTIVAWVLMMKRKYGREKCNVIINEVYEYMELISPWEHERCKDMLNLL